MRTYTEVVDLYIKRCFDSFREILNWNYYDMHNKNVIFEWLKIIEQYAKLNDWNKNFPDRLFAIQARQKTVDRETGTSLPTDLDSSQASASQATTEPQTQRANKKVSDDNFFYNHLNPHKSKELANLLHESMLHEQNLEMFQLKKAAFDDGIGICNLVFKMRPDICEEIHILIKYIITVFPEAAPIKELAQFDTSGYQGISINPLSYYMLGVMCNNILTDD